jgi:hypothetical protein
MRSRWAGYLLACGVVVGATAAPAQDAADGGAAFARCPMVRGTVTSTAADHLTIKTETGEVYEIDVTPNTRMTKDRQPVKVADVKVGDGVGAMGELDAPKKTLHALFVGVMDAEQVKKMREDLGKTYITGKVTAIDEVKITVMRPDHVSQTIEVDETTSFRKGRHRAADGVAANGGGEMVTLADVKVGDMIAGQGGLKHGTFVPTTLSILPPGAEGVMGVRGRRGEGGAVNDAAAKQ